MKDLYFVTSNLGKVDEAKLILNMELKVASLELPEIQSLNVEEIARQKAVKAFELVQSPLFVEDTGLFIKAWNGFPGPFIKYLKDSVGNDGILNMLKRESNRGAIARTAVAFYDGKDMKVFTGEVEGEISDRQRGESWGWDPIFIPQGSELTYAEMSKEGKNKVSHRRKAFDEFKIFLSQE